MKNLLIILLLLAACSKPAPITEPDYPVTRNLVIEQDTMKPVIIAAARGGIKGKPPKPTTPPYEPPTPPTGTGYSCILIDFNGQNVLSQWWNNGAAFNCAPSGLTDVQQAQVLSEARALYAAYNVTITTSEDVYNGANQFKRMRVIVTTTSAWAGQGFSGIAYTGSMTWGDNTPAFVFSDRLYFLEHFVAEITAHEAGHTVGLSHQTEYDNNCNLVSRYKNGAVMGNSMNSVQGQWIYGTTYACNAFQDDNAVLASVLSLR